MTEGTSSLLSQDEVQEITQNLTVEFIVEFTGREKFQLREWINLRETGGPATNRTA